MADLVLGNKLFTSSESFSPEGGPYLLPFTYPEINNLQKMYLETKRKIDDLQIAQPGYQPVPDLPKIPPISQEHFQDHMSSMERPEIQGNVKSALDLIRFETVPKVLL